MVKQHRCRRGIRDVNRDGDSDIVIANGLEGSITVLRNKGDGTFAVGMTYSVGDAANALAVGDVNRDGYPDIVTASGLDNSVTVLRNKGDGTFAKDTNYNVGLLAPPGALV